jgi:Putative transposase/Transposase zinc-binding domain
MIPLSSIIERFGADYLAQYPKAALPSQRHAMRAIAHCRTSSSPHMLAQCEGCHTQRLLPHSCGHRSCPHCQHFEGQRWIEQQSQRLVAGQYFLITFTVPAQLRALVWAHQRQAYGALMDCAWQTVRDFSKQHRHLQGTPGAVAVLHTHSRQLEFHPHVHLLMPSAALDEQQRLWRTLPTRKQGPGSKKGHGYLFNHQALAKVFMGKLMQALRALGLPVPSELAKQLPTQWVVDVKGVGDGRGALAYLGKYLYRGVIQDKDIIACHDGMVTYRWRESRSGQIMHRTVSAAHFLKLVLQHVLPKGLRRSRNYGFLHPNSKRLISLLKLLVFKPAPAPPPSTRAPWLCAGCGACMRVLSRRLRDHVGSVAADTATNIHINSSDG